MSSGWVGPGAKSSPQNESELAAYKALKRRLEAEERHRRTAENERRASLGLKPGELLSIRGCFGKEIEEEVD